MTGDEGEGADYTDRVCFPCAPLLAVDDIAVDAGLQAVLVIGDGIEVKADELLAVATMEAVAEWLGQNKSERI